MRRAKLSLAGLIAIILVAALPSAAFAQEAGVSASVPVVDQGDITIDGNLNEWVDVPLNVTVEGPQPSDDPGTRGRLRWQVTADSSTVYLAATVTDDLVFVGNDPSQYFNDDSIEFYINVSGNQNATEYGPGIAQFRITPVGLAVGGVATGPDINGNGFDQFSTSSVVFATNDGWGTEMSIDVSEFVSPATGDRIGLQIQLNGSSGDGRDIKLSWSSADVNDVSFQDPSVFAQGVFVTGGVDEEPTQAVVEASVVEPVTSEIAELESAGPEIITGEQQQRSLLIAAVASSFAVLFGGLWFERKRKRDEAQHRAEQLVDQEPDPHESILDGGL